MVRTNEIHKDRHGQKKTHKEGHIDRNKDIHRGTHRQKQRHTQTLLEPMTYIE